MTEIALFVHLTLLLIDEFRRNLVFLELLNVFVKWILIFIDISIEKYHSQQTKNHTEFWATRNIINLLVTFVKFWLLLFIAISQGMLLRTIITPLKLRDTLLQITKVSFWNLIGENLFCPETNLIVGGVCNKRKHQFFKLACGSYTWFLFYKLNKTMVHLRMHLLYKRRLINLKLIHSFGTVKT